MADAIMAVKAEENDPMLFSQIDGLNKTYAHYLLFKKDSPTLNTVITSLALKDKSFNNSMYTTLLGIRNREHINAALKVYAHDGNCGSFNKALYNEMKNYVDASPDADADADAEYSYDSNDLNNNKQNVDLIHETVINHYPIDGSLISADETKQNILKDARENLKTSLNHGYYKNKKYEPKFSTKPPPENINELTKFIKQNKILEGLAKLSPGDENSKLSAVASLYADAHWVDVGQALQVVATAHTTGKSGASRGASRGASSGAANECEKNKPGTDFDIDFVIDGSEDIKINVTDYGVVIRKNGKIHSNRCLLLSLAHALNQNACKFYGTILDFVKVENESDDLYKDYQATIRGDVFIDIDNFFRYTTIEEVDKKGLICLTLTSEFNINFKTKEYPDDNEIVEISARMLRNAGVPEDEIKQNVKAQLAHLKERKKQKPIRGDSHLPRIIGNPKLSTDTILIITNGGHFMLGKMTPNILKNLIKEMEYNPESKDITKYAIASGDVLGTKKSIYDDKLMELNKENSVGGFKRSAYKTKKRGGRLHMKTHRRK